ncbi:hypothetical protein R3P38DRAFT_3191192 [Favolaschia claudopus]|uniref:HMG box domain-containing protein n=1 Tax=Favolaschia claudopus TaxID=2862362 RepID=A0AAW0BL55_9AGAR
MPPPRTTPSPPAMPPPPPAAPPSLPAIAPPTMPPPRTMPASSETIPATQIISTMDSQSAVTHVPATESLMPSAPMSTAAPPSFQIDAPELSTEPPAHNLKTGSGPLKIKAIYQSSQVSVDSRDEEHNGCSSLLFHLGGTISIRRLFFHSKSFAHSCKPLSSSLPSNTLPHPADKAAPSKRKPSNKVHKPKSSVNTAWALYGAWHMAQPGQEQDVHATVKTAYQSLSAERKKFYTDEAKRLKKAAEVVPAPVHQVDSAV